MFSLLILIIIILILFLLSHLLTTIFLNSMKFNFNERIILYIIISFIIIIFNMLLLMGRYGFPFIASLFGYILKFSLQNFFLLLLIEVILLTTFAYKLFRTFIKKDIKFSNYFSISSIIIMFFRSSFIRLLMILISIGLITIPHILAQSKYEVPATINVWYYQYLTNIVLDNGFFPETMYLYGETVNFDATYVGYNLFSGAFYAIINLSDNSYIKFMTIFTIIFASIYALAFFNRFIPFHFSLAGVVIMLSMKLFIYKLATFRTEALAIVFLFMSLWINHKAINEDNTKLLLIGGIVIALLITINASIVFVSISYILSFSLINSIFENRFIYYAKKFLILCIIALIMASSIFFISVGRIPIIYSLFGQSNILVQTSEDQTWGFLRALNPNLSKEPSFIDYFPIYVYNDFVNNFRLIFIIILISTFALFRKDENNRKNILSLELFMVILIIVSVFFYKYYNTFVPARSGFKRIFPYTYISFSLIPIVVLNSLPNISIFLNRFNRKIIIPYKFIILASLILLVLLINMPFLELHHQIVIRPSGYQALVWLRENTDPDMTVILTNEWAMGGAIGISRRKFLNDGDAPYLRPKELPKINSLIFKVRAFYRNPKENIEFLKEYKISHVLVSYRKSFRGVSLLNDREISEDNLRSIGLRLVHDAGNVKVYNTELFLNLEQPVG